VDKGLFGNKNILKRKKRDIKGGIKGIRERDHTSTHGATRWVLVNTN
jgi:hypothetical protein